MSRSPILPYADSNPIPTFTEPSPPVDPNDTWLTEDGAFDVITEDSLFTLSWDADMSSDN